MARKITWQEIGQSKGFEMLSPAFVTESDARLVFTSGCIGNDPATGAIPEDLEEQARLAFQNMKTVLISSGSSMENILKVLLFVADGSYAPIVNKIYLEYFPGRPARSCVVVSFPAKEIKLELECIAQATS